VHSDFANKYRSNLKLTHVIFRLELYLFVVGIPERAQCLCKQIQFQPEDDSFESKHVAVNNKYNCC